MGMLSKPPSLEVISDHYLVLVLEKQTEKNNNPSLIEFSRSPKEQIMPLDKGLATIQQI